MMALVPRRGDAATAMLLVRVALLHVAACFDVQVEGDLVFDLRVPNSHSGKGRWLRVGWEMGSQVTQELTFRMSKERKRVTAAPQEECVYQYPEQKQVDALLSDMMNKLTKVFVRANELVSGIETDDEGSVKKELRDPTRFKVVHEKKKPFFELMFYNTYEQANRTGRDPCMHQAEVKQLWSDLLERAQAALRSAAKRCVDEYLRDTPEENKAQVRESLKQFVKSELGTVRTNQLNMLCDTFQLCYNDFLT